jgi:hypothetical protein
MKSQDKLMTGAFIMRQEAKLRWIAAMSQRFFLLTIGLLLSSSALAQSNCITSSNYVHQQSGRATTDGFYTYAQGSGQNMGFWNVFVTTTLQQTGTNYYVIGCTAALVPPATVSVGTVTNTSIALSWSAVSGVAGYDVYKSTTSGGSYAKVNSSLVTATNYTVSGLTVGMTYYFVVKSVNSAGTSSAASAQVSASTSSASSTAVPATPLSQHTPVFGVAGFVSAHSLMQINQSGADKDTIATKAAQSGAKYIRLDVAWQDVEYTKGTYSWTNVDRSVQAVTAANAANPGRPPLQIVAVIQQTPPWASACTFSCSYAIYPPKDTASWGSWQSFVMALVNRYGKNGTKQISVWEIWNEPNLTSFWAGTASDYAKLYSIAYDAIKCVQGQVLVAGQSACAANGADSTATVLMGGLSSDRLKAPASYASFVNGMLNDTAESGKYAAKNRISAINAHIRGPITKVMQYVDDWRSVFANAGAGTGKPFWITEFGWPTSALFQRVESDSDPNNTTTYSGDPATINFVELSNDNAIAMAKQAQYYYAVIPMLYNKGVAAVFVTTRDLPEGDGSQWSWEGLIDQYYQIKVPDASKPNESSFNTVSQLNKIKQ